MARYNAYERQVRLNQKIEVPPDIDQAYARESIRGARELSQRAEQVKNFAFKRGAENAQREGAAAGAKDPTATLDQYGGERPGDIYGQAAFDAANKLGGVQVEAKAREAIGLAYLNAKKTKQDPNDLQAGLGAIIGGYTSALQDMDPLTAARTRAKLESYARSAFLDRSSDAIREQQKALDGNATTITDSMHEQVGLMGQTATAGGDSEFHTAMKDYTDSMNGLGQNAKVTAAQVAKGKDRYHVARARREFRDSKDKFAYIKKFREDRKTGKGSVRGIDDWRLENLTNNFEAEIRQADRLRVATIKATNGDIKSHLKILSGNGSIGENDLDKLERTARELGDPALIANVEFLRRENTQLQDLGQNGSSEVQRAADEANANIEAAKTAGKTTPQYLLDKAKRLTTRAEAMRRDEETDPLDALHRSNRQPGKPELTVGDMIDPKKMKEHIDANVNASRVYNVADVHLTQDTIAKLKDAFSPTSTEYELQAALASSIAEAAGLDAARVFSQIASQTEATEIAHIGALNNPATMSAYFKGRAALASSTPVNESVIGSMRKDLDKTLGASLKMKPGFYGDLHEIGEAVYIARHGRDPYNKDKYINIIHELVGGRGAGRTATGGLVKYKGQTLILPPDFPRDDDAFESAIEKITDESLRGVMGSDGTGYGVPVFLNPRTGQAEPISANQIKNNLKIMSLGAGLYVLTDGSGKHAAAGDLIDLEDGTTYYEMRRDPYVLDFKRVTQ